MKKEDFLKILVPIVAVLVIVESVVLVTGMVRQRGGEEVVEKKEAAARMSVEAAKSEVVVGEKLSVELKLVSSKLYAVDAVEMYVKYDPTAFEVTGLVTGENMPKATTAKVNRQKGIIALTFLIDEPDGYKLEAGIPVTIASFKATAKKSGSFDFKIATSGGAESSATMLVENGTSKVIPFDAQDLLGIKIN